MKHIKKIFISSDHAGFSLKQEVIGHFSEHFKFEDLGPFSEERCDYPDSVDTLVKHWRPEKDSAVGILLCGSGQGVAMRANKYPDVRAALCWNVESAQLARAHNDANILCVGARLLQRENIFNIIEIFLKTPFEGDRHAARVKKISSSVS